MARIKPGRPQLFIYNNPTVISDLTLYPAGQSSTFGTSTAGDSVTLDAELVTVHNMNVIRAPTGVVFTLETHGGDTIIVTTTNGTIANAHRRIDGPFTVSGGIAMNSSADILIAITYTVDRYAEA